MKNVDLLAELTAKARYHDTEAGKYRKAAAILTNGTTVAMTAPPTPETRPSTHQSKAWRRDRVVRAITKHGPLTVAGVCAYAGLARKNSYSYLAQWVKAKAIQWDVATQRYTLPTVTQ